MSEVYKYNNDLISLPFDQYQRYRAVADIINKFRVGRSTFKIIEVGAGFEENLTKFLPNDDICFLDKEHSSSHAENNYIVEDITEFDLNETYDIVVSIDTYEHIEPVFREKFINKLLQCSSVATIIAAPFDVSRVKDCEIFMNEFYKFYHDLDHRWLQEHIQNGLPSLPFTIELIKKLGYDCLVVPNGYLPRWFEMISLYLLTEGRPEFSNMMMELWRYYNKNFYKYDAMNPAYRQILIITKTSKMLDISDIYTNEHDLEDLRINYEILESFIEKIKTSYASRYNQFDDQFLREITRARSLEQSLAERDGRVAKLGEELQGALAHVQELEGAVSDREGQISALNDELQQAIRQNQMLEQDAQVLVPMVLSLEQDISEHTNQLSALSGELQQTYGRVEDLDQVVSERGDQIAALNGQLQQTTDHAQALEQEISKRDKQTSALNDQLSHVRGHAQALEHEIAEMRRSVVWQLVMKYHNGFVERALPHGTGRRRRYDLGLKGGRILANEGWGYFWWNFKEYNRKIIRGKSGSSTIVAPASECIPEHSEECLWNTNPKRCTGKAFIQMNKVDMVADKEEIGRKLGDIIEEIGREL